MSFRGEAQSRRPVGAALSHFELAKCCGISVKAVRIGAARRCCRAGGQFGVSVLQVSGLRFEESASTAQRRYIASGSLRSTSDDLRARASIQPPCIRMNIRSAVLVASASSIPNRTA